jgi:ribosomal-protein-alanine N-acetyltransferase
VDTVDPLPVVADAGPYVLRPWDVVEDVDSVLEAGTDPVIPSITSVPRSAGVDGAVAFIERQHQRLRDGVGYSFAIAPACGGSALGQMGVWTRDLVERRRVTLGYWVAPSNRRLGIAASALLLATEWARANCARCVVSCSSSPGTRDHGAQPSARVTSVRACFSAGS